MLYLSIKFGKVNFAISANSVLDIHKRFDKLSIRCPGIVISKSCPIRSVSLQVDVIDKAECGTF